MKKNEFKLAGMTWEIIESDMPDLGASRRRDHQANHLAPKMKSPGDARQGWRSSQA